MFVFLPLLIFSDSMRMNIHLVKGSFVQTVLLATTGVYLGALIMGTKGSHTLFLQRSINISLYRLRCVLPVASVLLVAPFYAVWSHT